MASFLNPFSGRQFLDASGDPYTGAKLFTYTAGSSTKVTVTKDSAGTSNHANPIVLNARGEPADGAGAAQAIWQAEGVTIKLVLAPASDSDPPTSPISTWDNISGINDVSVTGQSEWISGPAPTYVSATSFTLVGDQTSDFHVGRRLKTTNSGGTIYSVITVSAYTTLTTITVVNDSGSLDSGLSAVSYGLLSSTNPSISSEAFVPILGPDIASAAALPYPAYGNYSDVTGTNAITSMNTSGIVGTVFKRHFDGVLVLTNHATNLIMPGGANYTTVAGDEFEFTEYASGQVRVTGYALADGKQLVSIVLADLPSGSKLELQTEKATTSGTEIDFTSIPSWVKKITIMFDGVSTNGTSIPMIQLGDAGGFETTGYNGSAREAAGGANHNTGFIIGPGWTAAEVVHGSLSLTLEDSANNVWSLSGMLGRSDAAEVLVTSGTKALSAILTQIRLTTVNGTDAFDAGAVNILLE